ncbi:F-box/kelch-repeat protein At5g42350-like [Impatiens glandulifera]|uniref:F-box/kelch-repeat protein At5g42350-like n=1 Tax=Impatiens glandulifera TaxID=253017 RepID=UPI001FB0955E|nr:F-box/kelch-repeat protein At5g42350-like [Impatiens glandulifera]
MVSESLTGETSLSQEFQALSMSMSKGLVRNPSPKQKSNNKRDEINDTRWSSWKCLNLNGRNGSCKVVAETNETFVDQNGRRKSSSAIDCFSYGMKEKFWKRNARKTYKLEPQKSRSDVFLPDDILEMCLVRLPLTSLMNARLVCKKWRYLTTNQRFIQMRQDGLHQNPWLFLFGIVKDGYSCSSEIHSLDVSNNQWHRLDASILKGRFMFSVASAKDSVYIVGGCSSLTNLGKKTHKGVLLFRPLSKSWHKMASMKYARSSPILGTCSINRNKRFVLIAIGGVGSGDERLETGEIYDSTSNKWSEIQRLPVNFGIACSGVVCNRVFYVYSESDKLVGFDVERGYWVWIETVSIPPRVHEYYPKLICLSGRLFMLSVLWCEGDGEIGRRNKAVRKVWELDFVNFSWFEVSTHPDAPMDWNAVFVSDRDVIFGVEMFKIFGQVLDFLTVCDVSASGEGMIWRHVSRNKMANELDAYSCVTKSIAVVHL